MTEDFDRKLKNFDKSSRQRLRYYAQYTKGQEATEGVKLWVRTHSCDQRSLHTPAHSLILPTE